MDAMDTFGSRSLPAAPLRAPGMAPGGGAQGARRSAQEFEAFFVTSMLESMSAGLKPDKLFGGGQGEGLYRSMLNQEYGKAIAAQGSLGIANAVQKEILRMQQEARL